MSGEAWSCFARLPPGLIDQSVSLTLNWLKPKPTLAGYQLTAEEVDEAAFHRNVRIQRQAKFAAWFLGVGVSLTVVANFLFDLRMFADQRTLFTGVWAATTCFLLAIMLFGLYSVPIMRFRRAEPRRIAFNAAAREFAEVDAWRAERCSPSYWSDTLDATGFEREAAELLAGVYKTGQVSLTRDSNDYGVDVLVCHAQGRVVAQCKHWKTQAVDPAAIRELAGSKAYFGADVGVLICLRGPGDRSGQINDFIERQNLVIWDLEALVLWARRLKDNGNGNGAH